MSEELKHFASTIIRELEIRFYTIRGQNESALSF